MISKSLLTQQDIKNFIYEAIETAHPRETIYYSATQLSRILHIEVYYIKKYTGMGMPFIRSGKTRKYNINKVVDWLDKHNIEFTIDNNA